MPNLSTTLSTTATIICSTPAITPLAMSASLTSLSSAATTTSTQAIFSTTTAAATSAKSSALPTTATLPSFDNNNSFILTNQTKGCSFSTAATTTAAPASSLASSAILGGSSSSSNNETVLSTSADVLTDNYTSTTTTSGMLLRSTATRSTTPPLVSQNASLSASALSLYAPITITNNANNNNNITSGTSPASAAQLLMNGLVSAANNSHNQQPPQILLEDPRTLQLALELSMVSLNDGRHPLVAGTSSAATSTATTTTTIQQLQNMHFNQQELNLQQQQQQQYNFQQQYNLQQTQQQQQKHNTLALSTCQAIQQQSPSQFDLNTLNAISAAVAAAAAHGANDINKRNSSNNNIYKDGNDLSQQLTTTISTLLPPPNVEDRSKKSQNMTECVPVPSSEHVAEIVGRQGCKIKALRAKTNTYIKTPVRGEEPVFVVTGRKEDVAKAKREILSAAEHFSLIRATRRPLVDANNLCDINTNCGAGNGGSNGSEIGSNDCGRVPPGPPTLPGQITLQVRVPYRVVGLVVGPKGGTIKHIQQETQTYIVTPSREKEPIFKVTGLPDNVQAARKRIEAHIALRTGNTDGGAEANIPVAAATINTLSQILTNDDIDSDFLATIYKNGFCSAFDCMDNVAVDNEMVHASAAAVNGCNNLNLMANQLLATCTDNSSSNNYAAQNLHGNNVMQQCSTTGGGDAGSPIDYGVEQHFKSSDILIDSLLRQKQQQQHALTGSKQQQQQQLQQLQRHTGRELNYSHNNNNIAFNVPHSARVNINSGSSVINTNIVTRSCSSASSTTSSKSANGGSSSVVSTSRPELLNIWKNIGDSIDIDEGIGESPSIWTLPATASIVALTGSNCSPTTSISPTDSLLGENSIGLHSNDASLHMSRPTAVIMRDNSKSMYLQQQQQQKQQQTQHNEYTGTNNITASIEGVGGMQRECLMCNDREVGALVPCGHNVLCMKCTSRICTSGDATCPICSSTIYHAVHILA